MKSSHRLTHSASTENGLRLSLSSREQHSVLHSQDVVRDRCFPNERNVSAYNIARVAHQLALCTDPAVLAMCVKQHTSPAF
jgi:hypothetical protein